MAQTLPIAAAVVVGALVGGATAELAAGKPKMPKSAPPPTILAAQTLASNDDEFRKRQGAAANILTGPNGAEAPSPGAKQLLGQ